MNDIVAPAPSVRKHTAVIARNVSEAAGHAMALPRGQQLSVMSTQKAANSLDGLAPDVKIVIVGEAAKSRYWPEVMAALRTLEARGNEIAYVD